MPKSKFYLAGPMSNIPQCNFPMFDRVAKRLRDLGYNVVSPAELDDTADRLLALKSDGISHYKEGKSWGDFLARDVKLLADGGITGIIFLPGWWNSSGAKLEATLGLLKKFQFMLWDDNANYPVSYSRASVACALHQEFMQ
jgi:hypothetical protein